jgi:hypothetical protein
MLLNNKSMDIYLTKAREELDMMVRINDKMNEFIRIKKSSILDSKIEKMKSNKKNAVILRKELNSIKITHFSDERKKESQEKTPKVVS